MYVATVPNRNSPPAILLRESFREQGKVKNRTLANLSAWSPRRIDLLRRLLRGELDGLALTSPTCGPVFGLLFVLKHVADALGFSAALGKTRLAKLALFLVLARLAHRGSRLSAIRWARDHAVSEVLGLGNFDEEDLYAALDELSSKQENIEQNLYRRYLKQHGAPPSLFLYDVTSSYLEGQHNALGEFGYNRDGKRGKLQIVIGMLTDSEGEPLAVRVFAGNTGDPTTVADQIKIVKEKFQVAELVFVGDRGMVKSRGKEALKQAGLRYITALTDPQIRRLLSQGTLQMNLFSEDVCEVEADALRYLLRKNKDEETRHWHRLEDKLAKLAGKIEQRNAKAKKSPRCRPQSGLHVLESWISRHKLNGLVSLRLEDRTVVLERNEPAIDKAMQLAGCYVVVTDVAKGQLDSRTVHDNYMRLQKVERDFRQMKTGLLEVRPVFVRKESRTRGHVFCSMLALKLCRELERRLRKSFATTDADPYTVTVEDALAALGRLCLLEYRIDEETTLTRLPIPDETQGKILEALAVSLPKR